jgi:hypothetical protein
MCCLEFPISFEPVEKVYAGVLKQQALAHIMSLMMPAQQFWCIEHACNATGRIAFGNPYSQ